MKINAAITDKIIDTANALVAEGIENPTNEQVRERMGKGSLSHISPVMRQWRESQKAEVAAALAMPAEMKRAIETALAQVWTAASKLASTNIDTIRHEAEIATHAATGERDEALAEITRLEARIEDMESTLGNKDELISKLNAALETERGQVAELRTQSAALEAHLKDREEQIRGLKAELKETRKDYKSLQAELVAIARESKNK